ncbi:MAG: hypothetical protein FWC34_08985, partial [Bacteroidetes bacterium]|nr:hypothetical protein [Bacteroidota bacterium]
MKKLILDHLEHRLPANKAFLQYINEEMHSNLIALYSSFYPDSENNAYVLTGVQGTTAGLMVNYSQGFVFYNKEILFVPAFSVSAISEGERPHGFNISTTIINEVYASGQTLPAYEERILVFSNNVPSGPLRLTSLIRKNWDIPFSKMEIPTPGNYLEKKEAQVITNGNTQRLLMHLQVLSAASDISTGVRFQSVFSKKGFIGFGKAINKTTQRTFDVCVYQIGNFTLIKRPWDA